MRLARRLAGRSWIRKWSGVFVPPVSLGRSRAPSREAGCLALDEDATVSALGFAANATGGLNEWPYCGGDEMFFHPGFAARNAVTAVELALLGARASESALDGRAGLFAGLNKTDRIAHVAPFSGGPLEILSVYYKPAPACNYAQTACQAALALTMQNGFRSSDVESIVVKASAAAVGYPGCDYPGPFERILQAKMSIQYCVAATLARGVIAESNYHLLDDPEVMRLASITKLETDPAFTAAYPGSQGSEVSVKLRGRTASIRMDDVIPATPDEIRARFRSACANWRAIEEIVEELEVQEDVAILSGGLAA